jgi:polysaccharide export outer membrane protein
MLSKSLIAGLLALLLGFSVSAAPPQSPDAAAPATPPASEPSDAQAPPPTEESASQYIIGPGDSLQVFVWRNAELSTTVPVRPDGKISTPLVENMVAVGKTPTLLARDMERVLAEYVRSPKVNIIVVQAVSTYSQVKVVGQVGKPGAIPFREGLTVLDVVLQVGGLGPYAAGNRAKIMRNENGKSREIRVKLADLMNGGDMKQNVPIKPGDVIVVPQTFF